MTHSIPKIFKVLFTLYLLILIPGFWMSYGPTHFLWLSHIILLMTYFATLFESKFLASMASVGYLPYAIGWTLDFLYTLVSPVPGFTEYMLNVNTPLGLRALSLFHAALIPLLLWLTRRLGYDARAWPFQISAFTLLLFLTWALSSPYENINLAYGYLELGWKPLPYLVLLSFLNALAILATHAWLLHGNKE